MTNVGSVYYDRRNYLREKRRAMEIWSDWLGTKVTRHCLHILRRSGVKSGRAEWF